MKSLRKLRFLLMAAAAVFTLSLSAGALEIVSVSVTQEEQTANNAPIAENLEFTTYRNVPITGQFAAVDPENDQLSFRLCAMPKKGTVEVNETGFVYSPKKDKKGKDSFTYVAVDSFGNRSAEATVTIKIEKQTTKVTYADMSGHEACYAALRLAEQGLFIGEQVNGVYYFRPEETLSRGEFLSLCLSTVGLETLEGITRTGFSDDALIPGWEKAAVSTALMAGIVKGYTEGDGRVVFSANAPITGAEALVMLNNSLRLTDVRLPLTETEATPVWAVQAAANLNACSVSAGSLELSAPVDRSHAAQLLSSALDLLDRRQERGSSLLSWAR